MTVDRSAVNGVKVERAAPVMYTYSGPDDGYGIYAYAIVLVAKRNGEIGCVVLFLGRC